jgi:hypothetical protein
MTIPPRKFVRRHVVTAYYMTLSNAVMRVLYWNTVNIEFRANRSNGSKGEMKTHSTQTA